MSNIRQNIYSVTQVNRHIKEMFRQEDWLRRLYVRGEVSNLTYHKSGHVYFTLKDEGGTLSASMWKSYVSSGMKTRIKVGDQVIAFGGIDVYEKNGSYSFHATEIILDGTGDLNRRFEELKNRLEEMGMFSSEYKKPIPAYAKTVGIVTAPTGAAIQDIRRVAYSKNPYVKLVLYPAIVQGEEAAPSIVKGIHLLEAYGVDVMIVGRGGGSIEDLWAFNTEEVARAIFECDVPVISAVGHETDTTISDFVADIRVPTPTKAAELAVCNIQDYFDRLSNASVRLGSQMTRRIVDNRRKTEHLKLRLDMYSPQSKINDMHRHVDDAQNTMTTRMQTMLQQYKYRLQSGAGRLEDLSPLKQMRRGYAYVTDEQGSNVKHALGLEPGEKLDLQMIDGAAKVQVLSVEAQKKDANQ